MTRVANKSRARSGKDAKESSKTSDNEKKENTNSKGKKLPRQMIHVQRTEPSEGIVRNELRFVSYAPKPEDGKAPLEMHIISEVFSVLVSRLREMDCVIPELEQNVATPPRVTNDNGSSQNEVNILKEKLAATEKECEHLKRNLDDLRTIDTSSVAEPEWVRKMESNIKALYESVGPLHDQTQKLTPQLVDMKAHLMTIMDEINECRSKKKYDEKTRVDIKRKLVKCQKLAGDAHK